MEVKVSRNPFGELRNECVKLLSGALVRIFPASSLPLISLDLPPSMQFGELASSVCFELAKRVGEAPKSLAERIVREIDVSASSLVRRVEAAGGGYINFYADYANLSALTLESARKFDSEYGLIKTDKPKKVIVEHTSVNPVHPIHIGQARNPILGDALARILKARGHKVYRHYYIDDVGRQTAVIAYGYKKLGMPKPEGKPDHFIGVIYTITNCITEIQRLKRQIEDAKKRAYSEELQRLQRQLDDWMSVAVELETRYKALFNKLLDEILKDENPEEEIGRLIRDYEAGKEEAKNLIRRVCELCLEGFKQTLSRAGIFFDSWDWESELAWTSKVQDVIVRLEKTPYVFYEGGVLEFDAEKVARDLDLKKAFGLKEDYEVPSLTLIRADGTTLYTTRDIAYSIEKFGKAEWVINVVGMEQTLPQLQIKLALCALGYVDYAKNLTHFAYNLVTLPGYKMSSRRGRYITFDEVMDEAIEKAYQEVSKRSPNLSEEEKRKISNFVGIGAVKYALVEVDPTKPVVFTWDRVINFEQNSAPYIQYSHARACSILRKAKREIKNPDYSMLTHSLEKELILMLARWPEIFIDAAENLKPHVIAEFANMLADKFNSFYNALPVIKAEPTGLSEARLALTDAIRIVLRNSLNLIGIEAPQRM
ncbi:MAG TPA: arginine--tRNA ligase [Candidatus Bathyarchaeota archaeon]|nr:arginine--tRNA ligase [Candidatus Bathyarchaeota archaeon]